MSSPESETGKKIGKHPKWRDKNPSQLFSFSLIIASMVVILAGIHSARGVLSPVIMASFLAVLLLPPLKWLQSKGFSQLWSLLIVILSVLVIGTATMVVLTPQLKEFADDLPSYRKPLEKSLNDVLNVLLAKQNVKIDINFDDILPFGKKASPNPEETEPAAADEETRYYPVPRNGRTRESRGVPDSGDNAGHTASDNIRPVAGMVSGAASEKIPEESVLEPAPIRAIFPDSAEQALKDIQSSDLTPLSPDEKTELLTNGEKTEKAEKTTGTDADDPAAEDAGDLSETAVTEPPFSRVGMTSEEMVITSTNEIINFLRILSGEMSMFASSAFIIMLMVIFMLVEAAQLPAKIMAAFSKRNQFTNDRLRTVMVDIRRYMMIKTMVSLLVGLSVICLLIATHVRYPLLWGVIAFLLNFIPNIGSVIAAIPPILLAMVDHGMGCGLVVTAGMILINCGVGYVLEPKFLGEGLNLSPLVVLLSLIFSGWLLGPVGMFLSPPIAVICKIILQSFPETRWIAVLMANSVPAPVPHPRTKDSVKGSVKDSAKDLVKDSEKDSAKDQPKD